MDIIEKPIFHSEPEKGKYQLLHPKDVEILSKMPTQLLKAVLMTALYRENGQGSSYTIFGFEILGQSYNALTNTAYVELGPGIALFQDIVVSSDQDTHNYVIPNIQDGTKVTITYEVVTDLGAKRRVNDVTPVDGPDIFEETDVALGAEKQVYKIDITKYAPNQPINEKKNIVYLEWSAESQRFLVGRIKVNTNISSHRTSATAPHPDNSVTSSKIDPTLIGNYKPGSDLTIKKMSDYTKEICGDFNAPSVQRINRTLGGFGANLGGGYLTSTPYTYGIDDIFLRIVRDILLNARTGGSGPAGREWTGYNYKSDFNPCIAFETTEFGYPSFRVNPAALHHSAHGTRMAAKSGTVGTNGGPVNYGFSHPQVNPPFNDIDYSHIAGLCSLRGVNFNYASYDDTWIEMRSYAKLKPNEAEFISEIRQYISLWDTRFYKPYNATNWFEGYDYEFEFPDDLPNYMEDYVLDGGTDSEDVGLEVFEATSNYLLVGKKVGFNF